MAELSSMGESVELIMCYNDPKWEYTMTDLLKRRLVLTSNVEDSKIIHIHWEPSKFFLNW